MIGDVGLSDDRGMWELGDDWGMRGGWAMVGDLGVSEDGGCGAGVR